MISTRYVGEEMRRPLNRAGGPSYQESSQRRFGRTSGSFPLLRGVVPFDLNLSILFCPVGRSVVKKKSSPSATLYFLRREISSSVLLSGRATVEAGSWARGPALLHTMVSPQLGHFRWNLLTWPDQPQDRHSLCSCADDCGALVQPRRERIIISPTMTIASATAIPTTVAVPISSAISCLLVLAPAAIARAGTGQT